MNLVIVESPTKARTLSRFLKEGFTIMASMGHIRDLPKSELGVDVKNDFAPNYQVLSDKEKVIASLVKASKKAKEIYLATDPDREGEAIAFHVKYLIAQSSKLRAKSSKFLRITFHEITKDAILEALKHPGKINRQLVDAQQARRILDRLVGYNLSPLLWRKVRKGLSAGRVQSVVVRLIVDREKEIEAFRPEEYWLIRAEVRKLTVHSSQFTVDLVKIGDKKAEVRNKRTAQKIVTELKKATYKVESVDKKQVASNPPPPYITSMMQRAAANLFGWSSKKTMREAQRLYECGYITYHRTDSVNLAMTALSKVRDYIKVTYGDGYLPEKPRFYKTRSKLAQEAHEAIRPTKVDREVEKVEARTGQAGLKLYQLIKKRFIACQMTASIIDKTTVEVTAGKYGLRAVGEIMKFEGWRRLYVASGQKNFKDNLNNKPLAISYMPPIQLPELEQGEKLQLIKVLSEQKFTQPPDRYTESTLIKTLEKLGIGRPSTYAPTISTIQNRCYVEKQEGKFHPTQVGIAVTQFLQKYFQEIMNYDFTAQMEDDLDKIAQGKRKWVPVISEFYKPFAGQLKEVKDAKRIKIQAEKTGNKCPLCGKGDEVIRIGRFGKFLSCSRFPECKYTKTYIEETGLPCPGCKKGKVIVRLSKKGHQFYGCSRYPECKWASWKKPKEKVIGN